MINDYIIFDLETSGLNSKSAEIIEISAIKICGDSVTEEFNTLVRPIHPIDPASSKVNGITDSMVQDAPDICSALSSFLSFIGTYPLSGYNVSSFDLPILRRVFKDSLGIELNNSSFDILQFARERLSFLPNCKLSTIAAYLNVNSDGAHRALIDCYITYECYKKIIDIAPAKPCISKKPARSHKSVYNEQTQSLQVLHGLLLGIIADDVLAESEVYALKKWLEDNSNLAGNYPFDRVFSLVSAALEDGVLEQSELDEMLCMFKQFTSPTEQNNDASPISDFTDKLICLTGEFSYSSRSDMEDLISQVGGICKSTVTGKTDYVIVGSLGSPDWSCGTYGSKVKKALEWQSKGKPVQIIKECVLIDYLKSQGVIK